MRRRVENQGRWHPLLAERRTRVGARDELDVGREPALGINFMSGATTASGRRSLTSKPSAPARRRRGDTSL